MNKSISSPLVAVAALLCSSAGMAATVTAVPSNANPGIGESFSVTLSVFDMVNTAGPTLSLTYDAAVVSFTSMALPATGPFAATSGTFLVQHLPTFDILLASPFTGDSEFLTINFQAIGMGAANIVVEDDGGATTGWFDADTFDPIPTTYTQADVNVVPVPAAAWLIAPAVLAAGRFSRRRKSA
jgi:hypothetical protein